MIRMIGNHICKDCVSAMEVIQRERLPIEFHDMGKGPGLCEGILRDP